MEIKLYKVFSKLTTNYITNLKNCLLLKFRCKITHFIRNKLYFMHHKLKKMYHLFGSYKKKA
jgi:hypothetical protein